MASPPVIEDPAQASRRAKIRVGVAITLLVTAVGILTALNQRKPVPEETPLEAQPVAQESISSQATEQPAPPETSQAPETAPLPPAEPIVDTEASPAPPPPPVPGTLPAAATPAPKAHAAATLEKEAPAKLTTSLPAASPSTTPATPPAVTAAATPAKPAAPKAFEVQLGVFSSMENAKQLQAKLAEHGIPSHTETRVQVGPFKTRAEADAAREKLKALGISAVIAPK